MTDTTCKNCVFAVKANDTDTDAICYRNPPTPYPVQQQHPVTRDVVMTTASVRPTVNDGETCGEFVEVIGNVITS